MGKGAFPRWPGEVASTDTTAHAAWEDSAPRNHLADTGTLPPYGAAQSPHLRRLYHAFRQRKNGLVRVVDRLPQNAAVFLAVTALAGGTRLARAEHSRASRPRRPSATVIVCLSAAAVVLGSTLVSRAGGPVAGGVAAAFPTMSATLIVAVRVQGSRSEGAEVLTGLVRSLPCFFAFALTIAICTRDLGLWSFAIAATAAVTAAALPPTRRLRVKVALQSARR